MGRTFAEIDDALAAWIAGQALFFVGTAPLDGDGHVNVSPKGPIGTLRIVSPSEVAYLDMVGSGAETAAHLIENGRIVIMLCAFSGRPRIVRLHGRGHIVWAEDPEFDGLRRRLAFKEPEVPESRRAIVRVQITRIADSCGFGVPLMKLQGQRTNADAWARGMVAKEGPDAMDAYKAEKNESSIDGLPAWLGGYPSSNSQPDRRPPGVTADRIRHRRTVRRRRHRGWVRPCSASRIPPEPCWTVLAGLRAAHHFLVTDAMCLITKLARRQAANAPSSEACCSNHVRMALSSLT